MGVTHPVAIRNQLADTVVDTLDTGPGNGTLEFQTSADIKVAAVTFAKPAFGTAASGLAAAAAITSDSSAVGGVMAKARAKNSTGTESFACSVTVTGGGGDIQFNSVTITAGQMVTVSSLTYAGPP